MSFCVKVSPSVLHRNFASLTHTHTHTHTYTHIHCPFASLRELDARKPQLAKKAEEAGTSTSRRVHSRIGQSKLSRNSTIIHPSTSELLSLTHSLTHMSISQQNHETLELQFVHPSTNGGIVNTTTTATNSSLFADSEFTVKAR